jgi:uncharacterized protein YuzE
MDKNKVKVRYDKESDILYILCAEGGVKDTLEVAEDIFIEIDQSDRVVGIEIWQVRKNILPELYKFVEDLKLSVST